MSNNNQNKHVLVSGGLGDIGRAITNRFIEASYRVTLGDLAPEEEGLDQLHKSGSDASEMAYHPLDVTSPASVDAWWDWACECFGMPQSLVVSAAIVTQKNMRELSASEWEREIAVNLHGSFYLAQKAALAWSRAKVPGSIVLLGSWAAHRPHQHVPAYSVSKAAVRMLCQCLALEFAGDGIRVNEVAPGVVDAGLSAQVFDQDPQRREAALKKIPVGALIEVTEVADQVFYLCDPKNRHVTGSTLLMDGGLSLL